MPGVRCVLPAVPVGLIVGVGVLALVGARVGEAWIAGVLAIAAAVVAVVGLARVLAGRTERGRRLLGYVGSALIGLGIAAVLVLLAVASSLCGTFGEECSPEERAQIGRLVLGALAAPPGAVGLYFLADRATLR